MDEHRRMRIQTVMFLRYWFRSLFDESICDRCGFFVDRNLSSEIHSFLNWLDYPKGNRVLKGHQDWVKCAAVSSDGYRLFTGSRDNCIIVWNLLDGSEIEQWTAHQDSVNCLASHSRVLVSGSRDCSIRLWNPYTFELIRTLDKHKRFVFSLDLNRRGTRLLSGSLDGSVRLWSLHNGECIREWSDLSSPVWCVRFFEEVIISGSEDGITRIWDHSSGEEIRKIEPIHKDFLRSVQFNHDQSLIACSGHLSTVISKWPKMEPVKSFSIGGLCCCFHPLRPDILAFSDVLENVINVYDVSKDRIIQRFKSHSKSINSMVFSPDGFLLISASDDLSARIWDCSSL